MTSLTPTDVLMAAAAAWLLLVLCGVPGDQSRTAMRAEPDISTIAAPGDQQLHAVHLTVEWQERPESRHVPPPLPDGDESTVGVGELSTPRTTESD